MSLDTIRLSKNARQILFAKSLVEAAPAEELADKGTQIRINSLGGNKKNILFLVTDSQNKFLPDEQMDLLSNLISACKLTMADIALVNYYDISLNYLQLSGHFQSKKVLMFGIETSALQLPFTIPHFQIQPFLEQLYVTAPPLNHFLNNKDLKKELWTCLQKLFLNK
ncbi:MAG: hypothetical protein ABI184_00950 [Ginsengibacter sp.]